VKHETSKVEAEILSCVRTRCVPDACAVASVPGSSYLHHCVITRLDIARGVAMERYDGRHLMVSSRLVGRGNSEIF
jgi:hypothetical protein